MLYCEPWRRTSLLQPAKRQSFPAVLPVSWVPDSNTVLVKFYPCKNEVLSPASSWMIECYWCQLPHCQCLWHLWGSTEAVTRNEWSPEACVDTHQEWYLRKDKVEQLLRNSPCSKNRFVGATATEFLPLRNFGGTDATKYIFPVLNAPEVASLWGENFMF